MPRSRTSGCAIWRVWAAPGRARPAGAGRARPCVSRRQPAADASSIAGRLPPRPRAASSRPERTISRHQPSRLAAVFDHEERRRRVAERMEAEGVDVLFLAPSADLEYLTG